MKNEPKPTTFAYPDKYVVRLASGICCTCGRELKASDVELIGVDLLLICRACHHDVLAVERVTSR